MKSKQMFIWNRLKVTLLIMLCVGVPSHVFAGDFVNPPTAVVSDQEYTLNWTSEGQFTFVSLEVKEYFNDTFVRNVATSGTSITLSNSNVGNYRYDLSITRLRQIHGNDKQVTMVEGSFNLIVNPSLSTPVLTISPTNATYNSQYVVSWGNVSQATSYRLEEKVDAGSFVLKSTLPNTTTSVSFNNIAQGSYSYQVSACASNECSLVSQSKTINVAYVPNFTYGASTHTTILGDFNGDNKTDAFYQPLIENTTAGILPLDLLNPVNSQLHRSWTNTHPDISAIEEWSADTYGAYVGNFNSNPGDEMLLLGKREIILLHGDIVTPITLFPEVRNAIVSWNASNIASYSDFQFDANPADFVVHIGNLNSDGFDEIFLQAKSKGSTSYILSSTGVLIQTISNGFLNMEWSAESYSVSIVDGRIILTALNSTDQNNETHHNGNGAITSLENEIIISNAGKVIFIHTDLLGSPVAETNKDGEVIGND